MSTFRPRASIASYSLLPPSPISLSLPLSCVPCSISLGQFKLVIPSATHWHLVPGCRYAKNQLRSTAIGDTTCRRCARITAVFPQGCLMTPVTGRMMYRSCVRTRREIPRAVSPARIAIATFVRREYLSGDLSPPRNGFIGVLSVSFSL